VRLLNWLRSALYLALLAVTVMPWALLVLAALVATQPVRYWLCTRWTWFAIWSARVVCGIQWRVEGWENLPTGPAILLPKHQSTWETFWLPSYLPRQLTFVYKRELHWVPFFGWAMKSLNMINIDRSRGQDAFEQVVTQGAAHLREGWWIVIFPEGTRTLPGSLKRYKTGGVRLAVRTGAPVVPIAVNSGECWPRRAFVKTPGAITVVIGKPIPSSGRTAEELGALVELWIEIEMRRLAPHRYRGPYAAEPNANA
jgi:1-acyl-sn-glycerol-3-phosphate acyltransferase